jgi:hypothetical protein
MNRTQMSADFQDYKKVFLFGFLKKANILFCSRESAEIPPFPPLKKGGEGGF